MVALSLGDFSLNLLRLLCLGLMQPAKKFELFHGGEIFRFDIIPLIWNESATSAKNEIGMMPFGSWSSGFLGQTIFISRL